MKKGVPILGVAVLAVGLFLTGGVVIDHSVQELPPSTSQQSGKDGSGSTTTPDVTQAAGASNPRPHTHQSASLASEVIHTVAQLFGLASSSPSPVQTLSPGQGSGTAASPTPTSVPVPILNAGPPNPYRATKVVGTNISGLEFAGLFQPSTPQTYAYFKGKGLNTVRIPFDWNKLQPDLYGSFDSTAKKYLDDNIKWAESQGMSVILDAHNYGRRYIFRDGGFHDDFTSSQQHTFQLPYGDQDSTNGTLTFRDFGRGVTGTVNDPVAPASGYDVSFSAKINSFNGDLWNEFFMDTFYTDDNNRYSLVANPVQNTWALRQTVNGITTTLASGNKTWTLGQYYAVDINVNQATPGKINVSIDGTPLFAVNSVNSSASLTHGKVSMNPSGVNATIKNFTLNLGGDTTNGGPVERRVTDSGLPMDAWNDFWTKMSNAYKNDPSILGYDQNEPHDMPVPTAPNNYSAAVAAKNGVSEATATLMGQAMVNEIRATGDTKFVVVDMDHWANTSYFTTQYGANPDPWISDSLSTSKIVYSGHYYFDADHSGLYAQGSVPPTDSSVSADVEPFFQWCQAKNAVCYEGEFGVPNTSEWQAALSHFLGLTKQYSIWWTQWAGGDIYSSATTLQPSNSFTTDQLQMTTIQNFLQQ